ncbi:MAG: hypothetical protein PHO67_07030 [Candidatus Omnitrophica bacterium]|nr:hypothetical protein [Candidatus Omnitrophota bacterium]
MIYFGSVPSAVLFFMGIFLYGKHCNWRKLKETKMYLIKFLTVIVLAVLFKKLFSFLNSIPDISRDFTDTLEVILAIAIGIIWYKEYKKINKREPPANMIPNENLKKNEILKVSSKDGYWTCPSCNEKNKVFQDACSNCGQEVDK